MSDLPTFFARNDPEMVALLLWFGADPLHYDSGSRNAYDCATAEAVGGLPLNGGNTKQYYWGT